MKRSLTFTCAVLLSTALSFTAAIQPTFAQAPTHRFLTADSSTGRIAIIDEQGKTEWEMKIGPLHDLHLLSSGNVLL